MTADRVPVFGDRIMVRFPNKHVEYCAVVLDVYEGHVVVGLAGDWTTYRLAEWRWPDPGEWGDDEH